MAFAPLPSLIGGTDQHSVLTDTATAHGGLMLTVLSDLAEFERDLISARTGGGRERAKAGGVKLGRKPKMTAHQQREAIRWRDVDGEMLADIARTYNVSRSTISPPTTSRTGPYEVSGQSSRS